MRIANIIREIPAFLQGLAPLLEITDAPQVKNHWHKELE